MDVSKSSLSSNVLQMKFMKRSALRIEKEKSEEERKHIIDDEHWVLDLPKTKKHESRYIVDPSYHRCCNLVYGRMSFKGFNPEIEKLMKAENARLGLEVAEEKEKEIGVSEQEMAERYDTLVGTIGKKFGSKRQREDRAAKNGSSNTLKKKFKKPADD